MTTETRLALTEAILNDNIDRDFDRARKHAVFKGDFGWLDRLIDIFGYDVFLRCVSLNHNKYRRRKRVSEKTRDIVLGGECLFLTLTFNEKTLATTTAQTRRRLVARWLKSVSEVYVANIDYGGKNGREHYHALIKGAKIDYSGWHRLGAVKGERVRSTEDDLVRTSKYVVKLARHAQKESCGKTVRLVYSRCAH